MPYDRTAFITRTPLEGVAFDFAQPGDGFLADKLFVPKPVNSQYKKIYQADRSKLRVALTEKATSAEPDIIDEQFFSTAVTLEEHKLAGEVNPRDVRDADIPELVGDSRKTQIVTEGLLLRREQKAVTLATTTGNYPSGLTSAIASGSRWNETNGDPESDAATVHQALMNTCGRRANALAIGDQTLDKVMLSPYFRERTKYTNPGPIPLELIKALFKVDYLFVGSARYDSANEGATASIGGFWSDYAIMFVYNPSPSMFDVAYGLMALEKAPFWVDVFTDQRRVGAAGAMRRVTVGSEYKLAPGIVESSSSSKFYGGYLLRTVVA